MLPVSSLEDCSRPGESEEEEPCYTELQPLTRYVGSLITSSADPCLGEFPEEVCVEYIVSTEDLLPMDDLTAGCSTVYTLPDSPQSLGEGNPMSMDDLTAGCHTVYTLPDSPQSLSAEDCSLTAQDLLQARLYEDPQVYDDEDDDASVILDLMDLSFLDEDTRSVEEQELDYGHCFTDSIDTCPTVIVAAARSCTPDFRQFTPSPCPSPPMPTPSPSPCPSPTQSSGTTQAAPSLSPLTPITLTPTTVINISLPSTSSSSISSSSPSSSMTFHYYDSTISTATPADSTITILGSGTPVGAKANGNEEQSLLPSSLPLPVLSTINYNNNQDILSLRPTGAGAAVSSCSDSSGSSSSSGGGERRETQHQQQQQQQQQPAEDEVEVEGDTCTGMDFDTFDNSDDDENEEERDYKPYCGSRRGAKKNLLWKFLLWSLDNHSDVVSWTDVPKGVFKFVDTARVSTLWGQRKKKQDMTFEKLSRGIRHYYKRGLMERMPHTRLVYKFNWDKVPKRYRKA